MEIHERSGTQAGEVGGSEGKIGYQCCLGTRWYRTFLVPQIYCGRTYEDQLPVRTLNGLAVVAAANLVETKQITYLSCRTDRFPL